MSDSTRYLAFAATRNEGAFLVEWITWYRMLGFEVMVAHNDCTDHSPALLAAFERQGWVTVMPHDTGGLHPKVSAHRKLRRHPMTARVDWLLICDVDEFLVPHRGDGSIQSYMATMPQDADAVCFHWRCFGTHARDSFEDGIQHRLFTACGRGDSAVNADFKTLFRDPLAYGRFGDHAPDRADGGMGVGTRRFVDGEGRPIPAFATAQDALRRTTPAEITHRGAQMNHYILRSLEDYMLKRGTPSASAGIDRYTDKFFKRRNQNSQRDISALRFAHRFDALWNEAMALNEVRRLHHLCCADRVVRMAALTDDDPADDPRWHHHMAQAAKA